MAVFSVGCEICEEHTTPTEENAMQAPASHGGICSLVKGNSAPAATGMATTLYTM
uniref:Uncharacterized protein n=1 Tax=Oryza sativa subsp. japonica TaxID=39947 RepID=Q655X5_ORYSJ|nr:hypothetical protein [Oryza sativa Japonica Group]